MKLNLNPQTLTGTFISASEAEILDALWRTSGKPITIRQIYHLVRYKDDHERAYTTIATIVHTMVKRDLLRPIASKPHTKYEAIYTKDEFYQARVNAALTYLHTHFDLYCVNWATSVLYDLTPTMKDTT